MTLTKRIIPCIDVDLDEDGNPAVYTGVHFEDLLSTGIKAYKTSGPMDEEEGTTGGTGLEDDEYVFYFVSSRTRP